MNACFCLAAVPRLIVELALSPNSRDFDELNSARDFLQSSLDFS